MSDYKAILQDLQSLNVSKAFPVFVPTHQREIQFLPLTVKQQKDVIKGTLDAATSNAAFNKITNKIIKENCVEDLDFVVIDKISILIGLRLQSVGDMMRITDEDDDSVGYDVNLREHAEKFKTYAPTPELLACDFAYENVHANLRVPSLDVDDKYSEDTKKSLKDVTSGDVTEAIGKLYVFEMAKFLQSITIGENTIELANLSLKESVSIVESLPLVISNKIIKFIESVRDFESKYSTIEIQDKTLELPLDATFFNAP